MKIKQRPEDFSVKESWRFDEVEDGKFRVYLMDKQKLSTFDAVDRIRTRFGLRPGAVSFCGLKDKQGRTEQLIAVDGADVDLQDPDLRLKFLGRTDRALSAENLTSNRFSVTVRALSQEHMRQLPISAAEVNRLGVINYFDSQRFGSLKHGQGFIAKDLIRGDFEAALRNYMAQPSPLDRTSDAKVKRFWHQNWGHWTRKPPFKGNEKYFRILKSLRDEPKDFVKAFLQIDSNYRALLLFTYQSYLWNEGVRRLLQSMFPREHLFPMPYQAGTLLFHKDADPGVLRELRTMRFPLLAPDTEISDPRIKAAVDWVLGKEKLKLSDLKIEAARKMLFFKHEERDVLLYPHKLVLGRPGRDELNRGFSKLNVAFTLPPGAYATLVIKRLFHFAWMERELEERADQQARKELIAAERAGGFDGEEAADQEGEDLRPSRPSAPGAREGGYVPRDYERGAREPGGRERPGREAGGRERPSREPGGRERPGREPGARERPSREAGVRERPSREAGGRERPSREPGVRERPSREPGGRELASPERRPAAAEGSEQAAAPSRPRGFRAIQKARKEARQVARNAAKTQQKPSKKQR